MSTTTLKLGQMFEIKSSKILGLTGDSLRIVYTGSPITDVFSIGCIFPFRQGAPTFNLFARLNQEFSIGDKLLQSTLRITHVSDSFDKITIDFT